MSISCPPCSTRWAFPIPAGLAGRSLLPVIAGNQRDPDRKVYFEALSASLNRGWAPLLGIIQDGFKYIDLPVPELYDLRQDPARGTQPRRPPIRAGCQRSERSSTDFRSADPRRSRAPGVRGGARAPPQPRLRDGGAARPPAVYTEQDDPKRLIALDAVLQEVLKRYLAGDLAAALDAIPTARAPASVDGRAWMQLAELEREAGNAPAALDAMQRAVTLSPGDTEPLTLLGAYLTEAGRAREAADLPRRPGARAARRSGPGVDPRPGARQARRDSTKRWPTLTRARERDPSECDAAGAFRDRAAHRRCNGSPPARLSPKRSGSTPT